ncbi:MAG: hypothetical protein OEM79_06055 [Nitrosopumilus sp.]|nr:hypothetical protein [Nitrosopumilus sp.]
MKTQVIDPEQSVSDFVNNATNLNEFQKDKEQFPKETQNQRNVEEPVSPFKIRQLEQKQQLLVGLTNILFNKLEEMNPKEEDSPDQETKSEKKYAKIEFTDISWYKKLGTTL